MPEEQKESVRVEYKCEFSAIEPPPGNYHFPKGGGFCTVGDGWLFFAHSLDDLEPKPNWRFQINIAGGPTLEVLLVRSGASERGNRLYCSYIVYHVACESLPEEERQAGVWVGIAPPDDSPPGA